MKFKKVGQLALGCYGAMLSASVTTATTTSSDIWISSGKSDTILAGYNYNNSNHSHNNSGGNHNNNNNVNHQNYSNNNSSTKDRTLSSMLS